MDTLSGTFFRPNILFMRLPGDSAQEEEIRHILGKAEHHSMGVALFHDEPVARLGSRSTVNVWITDQSPDWEIRFDLGNVDLALLMAYKLQGIVRHRQILVAPGDRRKPGDHASGNQLASQQEQTYERSTQTIVSHRPRASPMDRMAGRG